MKGCLGLIIKIFTIVLVFFGLKYLGIIDFAMDKIKEHGSSNQEKQIEKAKDLVDLSEIDDEYSVDKNFKIMKNNVILIQHKASGQKIAVFAPKNPEMLTKADITKDNIQQKIDELMTKKNKFIKAAEVVKQGSFEGLGQNIPYVRIKAEISNLPLKDVEGIIGAAEMPDGKTLIIAALGENNKYSQIITEALMKKVKNVQ